MSNPSFENIDQWLFEFTEGNLSVSQTTQLMEFISRNPELLEELKVWQNAKTTANDFPEYNSAVLLKKTPVLLKPMSFVGIGIFLLLAFWGTYSLIPEAPLYSSVSIDADIIQAKDMVLSAFQEKEESLTSFERIEQKRETKEEFTRMTANNVTESTLLSYNKTEQDKVTFKEESPLITNNLSKTIKIAGGTQASTNEALSESREVLDTELYTESSDVELKNDLQLNLEEADYLFSPSYQVKAVELDEIVAYLNKETKKEEISDEMLAKKSSRIISGAEVGKMTFKKTINNTYRKIEKMVNQPIALRNTKEPHYHVPMLDGYSANPAMVGTAGGNRIQATSRMQWMNQENAQSMSSVSWDGYIYPLRGGIGVDVNYNNYAGGIHNYSVGLVYSPKFSINSNISFEPAVNFKMGMIGINENSSIVGQKIEMNRNNLIPFFENNQTMNGHQLWYRDAGIGLMLNTKVFYAGISADNLGRHYNNYYSNDFSTNFREKVHYSAVFGTEYKPMNYAFTLNGYAYYQNYGGLNELWLGGNFKYYWFQIGGGVSNNLDFAGSLSLILKNVKIHYNADFVRSKLLNDKILSHQISLELLLKPSRYSTRFFNF